MCGSALEEMRHYKSNQSRTSCSFSVTVSVTETNSYISGSVCASGFIRSAAISAYAVDSMQEDKSDAIVPGDKSCPHEDQNVPI